MSAFAVSLSLAVVAPNCSIVRHRPQGSLCSVESCMVCGKLLPSLMIIGVPFTRTHL